MINSILLQTSATAPQGSADSFGAADPYGIAMAIIAMGVVFTALILLYVTFRYVSKLFSREKKKSVSPELTGEKGEVSGEVNAAIALALHLYRSQLHDNEDPIITMKRVARTYSPWSSKIYGLTKSPK